ncbi:unnamed protein product [Effrenium voratum]|uniref:Uncharacterized protein n=1 Tax=Effrenium voratum TaxID=2562239 RepID=A0AA36NJU7_9DINO|nr:unnamed protein product [Effrenium voratum]CAJ1406941.1 unnamed protein product [Effrenium voratum]CAJ1419350.1 unnamed protein product [Effrenium voratum]|mmetsp:Transcript_96758/g.230280  ORF Transcript_96758/g.230280 Transcript_96758/m.230280 type:complete len:110 (-) Transcript_96758:511-840(-)|eukprot:CAMPEP_0181427602 /NCGR_PEP_ID=MMETSP1110-20121109/16255_1 /TAXON_ID=174948 /ORGANISM="Symbiodinium sp., Strain CCMP421" /LENGTH=109 /DNA_ID=CAMNT_0023550817 /DNA_START=158 /DNA_END=487 /DNA_ORIENTATION=+
MTGPMMWIAMQDLMQVALVVACVFAGWSLQTSACSFLTQRMTFPLKKSVEFVSELDSESTEEDSIGHADCREVFVQDEHIPEGLKILEQYGVLGAAPGAWTSRVVAPKA